MSAAVEISSEDVCRKAIRVGLSGAIAGTFTEYLFYGLDSYIIMKQTAQPIVMSKLFKGALPISILGSGFSLGTFFFCYGPTKTTLDDKFGPGMEHLSVLIASTISGIPSSIISVPADVMKKELVLSKDKGISALNTLTELLKNGGVKHLFLGWKVNVIRDVPFAAIKMSCYEGFARAYLTMKKGRYGYNNNHFTASSLNKVESAGVGLLSGVCTAILTCPIDCVNTRIKTGELAKLHVIQAHLYIIRKDGISALFRGLLPRAAILGLGSTVFWYCQTSILHML